MADYALKAKNNIDEHNCNLNVDSYNTDFSEGEHINEPAKISVTKSK
jgi:hypothetical protein